MDTKNSPKHQAIARLKAMTDETRMSQIEQRLLRAEGHLDNILADVRLLKSELSHIGRGRTNR